MANKSSNKIGGQIRAEIARKELRDIFKNDSHPMYLCHDIEFATRYNISRHTIYSIRAELNIECRTKRIEKKLKKMNTNKYTINDLSKLLGVKYQNLYKIITECKLPVKPDTLPIEAMIKYQKARRNKTAVAKRDN